LEQKAEHDKLKAENDRKTAINIGIYGERSKKVLKALSGYRGNKLRER
jgi:hypothetical protein